MSAHAALVADPRATEALMNAVLRPGGTLRSEYPLVFERASGGALVAHEEQGRVVSACALSKRTAVCTDAAGATRELALGLIGSVVTDPAHRGRGHATRVLQAAERELRLQGCLLGLLWADDPLFYGARGWNACGSELDFMIEALACSRLPWPSGVRALRAGDEAVLHALLQRHRRRIERTAAENAALLAIPGVTTLVREREGRVVAYACMGRGADLTGVVHEWAGDCDDVLAIVRALGARRIARGDEGALFLMAPGDAHELEHALQGHGVAAQRGVLAMGKLLDPLSAADLAASCFDARGAVQARRARAGADEFVLQGPLGEWTGDAAALLELMWPARGGDARWRDTAQVLGAHAAEPPPSPFVWGLDSI